MRPPRKEQECDSWLFHVFRGELLKDGGQAREGNLSSLALGDFKNGLLSPIYQETNLTVRCHWEPRAGDFWR